MAVMVVGMAVTAAVAGASGFRGPRGVPAPRMPRSKTPGGEAGTVRKRMRITLMPAEGTAGPYECGPDAGQPWAEWRFELAGGFAGRRRGP